MAERKGGQVTRGDAGEEQGGGGPCILCSVWGKFEIPPTQPHGEIE